MAENFGTVVIDLTTARYNKEYKLAGKKLTILESSATAAVNFQANTRDAVKLDLRKFKKLALSFDRFYLNHAAQPGKSITIVVGDVEVFDAEPVSVTGIESASGIIINPAIEEKQDTGITALATLETGKATAALQTTGNTALDTLHTSLTAMEGKQDTGITALATLETGKATAALQTTGNTALDTLHTSLTAMEAKQDTAITEISAVAPQAHGIDIAGVNTYTTIVNVNADRRHISISLQGSYDAIVSLDSGTTEHIYVPANSTITLDNVLILNTATIQGKNVTADENYEKLAVTVW